MKRRNLVDGDIPDNREIHSLILVDQDVAQAGDVLPWDLRCSLAQIGRQPLDRLPDDLEIPNDRILGSLILRPSGFVESFHVANDPLTRSLSSR
jgi:hypothetical protein